MKGQPSNKAGDSDIIQIIRDHPGIKSCEIAKKLGKVSNTIATKTKRLADEKKLFRQKEGMTGSSGYIYNLYIFHYAKKHNIPRIYTAKPVKSTLELQMFFHDCIRGLAL
jgi:IS30 family transposase